MPDLNGDQFGALNERWPNTTHYDMRGAAGETQCQGAGPNGKGCGSHLSGLNRSRRGLDGRKMCYPCADAHERSTGLPTDDGAGDFMAIIEERAQKMKWRHE